MSNYLTRRDFLQFSASAFAMLGLSSCMNVAAGPRKPRPIAAGAKVRFAQIGCGGKGFSDSMAHKNEDVVAICEIDWERPRVQELFTEFPNAKRYKDFRKMLIEMDDQIDAVGVAT